MPLALKNPRKAWLLNSGQLWNKMTRTRVLSPQLANLTARTSPLTSLASVISKQKILRRKQPLVQLLAHSEDFMVCHELLL